MVIRLPVPGFAAGVGQQHNLEGVALFTLDVADNFPTCTYVVVVAFATFYVLPCLLFMRSGCCCG